MNKRTKLLPCPFCGHDLAHVGKHPAPLGAWSYSVQCGWCRGSGAVWIEQSDAIAAWNRRAPPPGRPRYEHTLDKDQRQAN